ncbi:hypothetical protein HNP52_003802 [Sphingomonas kyeonggiensis]|uniref:DUF2306 domain-containing protein n=1 Tax=Sphingomonas kyeonggiensis TaxID=1268553 RepID=A0A7W7NSW8_9SPHN|nr:DUF2306 domain-containing protein [Sphingomonas kyeonggiensis]MBB4840710.1 hypothetical protein [Sphingomonas kyeonggiensis]
MATLAQGISTQDPPGTGTQALRGASVLLVAASWLSAALFGAYILAFYGGTLAGGAPDRWNESLPRLHEAATPFATIAIGAHFVTGGILLLLGPVQLIAAIRARIPALHRWLGRLYVTAAAIAGLGGLGFILAKGTVGGPAMDIGFGLYGALMVLCAALAFTNARARRFETHRAWAIRLFALAIGSWLYRMEYGFWFLCFGKFGHTADFRGGFDMVMDFAFYLPNLAVAEAFIRARRADAAPALRIGAVVALLAASAFILLATWQFTTKMWLPGMATGLEAFGGA